jgi:hypothetical protein
MFAPLVLLLVACGGSDPKSDAAVDVWVDVSTDGSKDAPGDLPVDRPIDAPADVAVDAPADAPADAEGDMPPGWCPAININCAPSVCRNGTCVTACTGDVDCLAPARCSSGSCRDPRPLLACDTPDQCASGFCEQGFCCERACRSPCESCALPSAPGKCQPVPADAGCGQDASGD